MAHQLLTIKVYMNDKFSQGHSFVCVITGDSGKYTTVKNQLNTSGELVHSYSCSERGHMGKCQIMVKFSLEFSIWHTRVVTIVTYCIRVIFEKTINFDWI